MQIRVFHGLPHTALALRVTVFVEEQGFVDEVDAIDDIATHLVAFDDAGTPIGTCRIFMQDGDYLLGRLCVRKESRGTGVGRALMKAAEDAVKQRGGSGLRLHSQYHACGFYEAFGYEACSEIQDEQGCPHVWMKKEWSL